MSSAARMVVAGFASAQPDLQRFPMVDQVKTEQPVTIRFSALKTAQTLEVEGVLNRVGADQ